ncbi:uncharacterized protein LOC144911712 isoform X1 [Branchiostoma floridae x Branchiostoma belcheri]
MATQEMDERLRWLETRITSSLRPRNEDLKNLFTNDETRSVLVEYITNEDLRCLYIYAKSPKNGLQASLSPPAQLPAKAVFFLKTGTSVKLTKDNMDDNVIYIDGANMPLEHMDMLARDVFLPLLCTETEHAETVAGPDKLMDVLHRLMSNVEVTHGHQQGSIVLPLPSIEVLAEAAAATNRRAAVIHVLESTVIGWIKQIRGVLKHDPVAELSRLSSKPRPQDEVQVWSNHLSRLHSINSQLDAPIACDILLNLEEADSSYSHSFQNVRREIAKAVHDTNEHLLYLNTMRSWLDRLQLGRSPKEIQQIFAPLVHTLYLVWMHSKYYHEKRQFQTLLRVVSNEIVAKSQSMVGDDLLHDTVQSYSRLKDALRVCAAYRGTYLDWREKANAMNKEKVEESATSLIHRPQGQLWATKLYGTHAYDPRRPAQKNESTTSLGVEEEWKDSPWPPRNARCFDLMNRFMERCNDVLELVETTRHFRLLESAAEIGGAGGRSLDALVQEIHQNFAKAMDDFITSAGNILDVDDSHNFNKSFFKFRSVVKDLEAQLASVLNLSFLQCPTVASQLRLLEVFEGVSSRELVQKHLKDKDRALVSSFTQELLEVKTIFNSKVRAPPMHTNLPRTVSKLLWIKGLQARITEPMEKFRRVSPHSLEGDAGWQMRDAYKDAMKEFQRCEKQIVEHWQKSVQSELRDRLKQPLLVAENYDEDEDVRPQIVHVNLDPELILLLREIHYFSQAPYNIKLPQPARALIRNTDAATLRVTAARLETIVSKYNEVMRSISEVERPLFERKLAKIDVVFDEGLHNFTWKTTESADFIEIASSLVCNDLHGNLTVVQTNCDDITLLAGSWSQGQLDVFAARDEENSYTMDELVDMQKKLDEDLTSIIVPSGHRIHTLLQESFEAVQISRASPAWEAYVEFVDSIVLDGLKRSTVTSLETMHNQLVMANISQDPYVPILTIRLELIENVVSFNPPLDQNSAMLSVQELVTKWLESFLSRGALVQMLGRDSSNGYEDYIAVDDDVKQLVQQILQLVRDNAEECKKLLDLFKDYHFLWMQHVQQTFDDFLHGKLSPNPLRSAASSPQGLLRQIASAKSDARSSASGRSRADSIGSMQSAGVLGTAERSFLTPKHATSNMNVPSLDDFDNEIDIYRVARDNIHTLQDHQDVGWLRVDIKPIKQVLITHASRWMWTFTKYLTDQVTEMLTTLDKFLKRIEPDIEGITGEERDTASFMRMMRLFNEVSAQQQEMDGKFQAMHRTVLLLEKYQMQLPAATERLFKAAPGRWNNLKTKVSLAKQRLGPRIQEESRRITKDLARFGMRVDELVSDISQSEVYMRECTFENAWEILGDFRRRLDHLENEAQDLIELQELLETAVVNFSLLPQCRQDLRNLKLVWETWRVVSEQQNDWRLHRWQKIDTKFLRTATQEQLARVKGLPEDTFVWDVYMGMQESIVIIQACLPLIDDLRNPAMRTRHWKQLVRITGGVLQIDNDSLKKMTLGQLLELGLQRHVDDVRNIVQRAVKEVTIESSLKTYEEIWLSKLFELLQHIKSKPTTTGPALLDEGASQYSGSEATHTMTGDDATRPSRRARATSRTSNNTSISRTRRGSTASLPASLANLGEDSGQLFLLTNTEAIFEELESHQVSLQSMGASSAAGSFSDEVLKWQKRLQTIEAVMTVWLEVQEKWVELEEVFSGADVRTTLSHDANMFAAANRDFRRLMRATEKNPNVLQCCSRKGILNFLEKMNGTLEHCRKSLLHHLERKRQKFPRFYFLSMEDVLHVVCNGHNLKAVSPYLCKLFPDMGSVKHEECEPLSNNTFQITAVLSTVGEKLPLQQPMECEGPIENWLPTFLAAIKTALQGQLHTALGHERPQTSAHREIHSAGARRVPVPDKKEGRRSKARSRTSSRAGSQMSVAKDAHEEAEKAPSWTLDHVTEIVQLATHIQMTAQVEGCLKAAEGGDKNAIQEHLSKLSNMLQATAVMLKGIDDEKDMGSKRSKVRKTDSQASLPRDKEQMDMYSQGYSLSHRGRSMLGSLAGSMYQMDKLEQGTIGTIEERNSIGDPDMEQRDTDALTEPMEPPIDTMKTLAPPVSKLSKGSRKDEEEEEKQTEPSEMKLMLFPAQIQKISNIIALLAHYKDVLQRFLDDQSDSVGVGSNLVHSFHWRSQIKYNYQEDQKFVSTKVLDMEFDYGFEYQGSASRLVITPQTERVFVSLTQAISANMGALCQGPPGHGKQETLRELSMCLGCPLYKFHCTHSMDTYMLGDIFKGLATTGCWVGFLHLDILQPSLLSVMAQLLRAVQEAQQAGKPAVNLQGEEVTLQLGGACFATISSTVVMGHTQSDGHLSFKSAVACLPSAILQLFRVVSVVNADLGLAMEVMLWSQGFLQAAVLAKKLITLHDLCKKMLTTVTFISTNTILGEEGVSGTHGLSIQNLKNVISDAGVTLDAMLCQYATEKEMAAMAAESPDLKQMPLVMDMASKWRNKVRSVPGYAGSTVASSKDSPNVSPEPAGDQTAQGQEGEKDAGNEADSLLPDAETVASMEQESLVTAIRNTFMPRLNGRDASIFMTLMGDLFPGVNVPMTFEGEPTDQRSGAKLNTPLVKVKREEKVERFVPTPTNEKPGPLDDMAAAITVATNELGLMPGTAFQARVAQLAQMANTHPAIIVTGPAGCGKSSCLQTFITAQRQMGKTVSAQTVFTRAMESEELFGFNDPVTREWHHGILPSLLRRYCMLHSSGDFLRSKPVMKILQLDGDVDHSQIEMFDSLLHHEGYLVTGNNERMKIADSLRIFWEMETLAHVSPSMVSRLAVLSMDMSDVGWQLVLARWLDSRPDKEQDLLRSLADKYIGPCLEYLAACTSPAAMLGSRESAARPRMRRVVPVTDANMVSTFCALLEALLTQQTDVTEVEMERFFNFAAIWAFAGTLEGDYRTAFSQWWRHQFVAGPDGVDYPESGEVWDYYVDTENREWTNWLDAVPAYSLPHGQGIPSDAYVHTVTVEQLSYLLGLLFDSNKPVMFVGEAGCGKTAIMKDRVRTFCMGEMAEARSITVRSNRFTTARWLWKTIEETLEWKHGRTYIPKGNKRLMVVVDDMNLARVDAHQSQSANEIIRQHIDCGGVFDPVTQQWRQVKNVTYVSTVNPNTTAPVPSLSSRLLRHFAIFNCPYPKSNELHYIFTTLLTTHFTSASSGNMMAGSSIQGLASSQHDKGGQESHGEEHLKDLLSTLVTVALETQDKMRSMFLNTSERVHYIFTIRDLLRIFKNLCLSLKPGSKPEDLLYLWTHECNWVYGHRMVNEVDVSRYKQAFVTAARKHFTNEEELNLVINPRQPIFSSIEENESGLVQAGPQVGSEVGVEENTTDMFVPCFDEEAMRDVMKEGLREYNKSNPIMKLSFHNTIMENIARLCRVIISPHEVSHAMLCGEGCPGVAPLIARLSAHLCGFQPLKINPLTTDSGDGNGQDKLALFKSELLAAYTRAGAKGEKLLCILTEDELLEEEFLVPITDFVVTGVTSRLFTPEEQTAIVNSIRTEVTQAGLTYTREIAWDFFLRTATKNFRICLIFPSMGPDFQRRCRSFPALFSRSNILFLGHWERQQLVEHAYYHLKDAENFPVVQRENLAHLLSSMHISLRQQDGQEISWGEFRHITNASYEKFVERFVSMSAQRFEEVQFLHERMKQILERIDAENKKAMQLKTQLEHERVVLLERKQGTIQLLAQIGQDTAITEQQVRIVRRQLQKIYHLKKSLPDYQVAHERAVYKAIAIVADTKKVVEAMNMDHLVALRSLHQPDPVLEDLMAAIIMLLKSPNSDLTWNKGAKRQMANLERFREELLAFDENQLPEETIEVVEQYLKKPGFTPETMQAKADNNVAVAALCKWVKGVVRYNRLMISKVKPLHNKVEQTAAAVEMAEHRMSTLETKRKALETRLQDLAKGFEEATIDKKEQEAKTELMDRNLDTAARFRKILAKEHEHFVQIFNSLARREVGIAGGVAMAAAFAIYLGPYDHGFRRMMVTLHWPHCLQERGVPLVIDSLDPMKGHVIDWAIDTGSPMIRDYSENGFTMGESSKAESELFATAQQELSTAKSMDREPRGEGDGAEEKVQLEETAGPDNDKSGTEEETEVPATEAGTEHPQTETGGEGQQEADMQYESEPAEGNGGENESEVSSHASAEGFVGYTVENMPVISKQEYNKYMGALVKLLVGGKQLQEWNTQGFSPHQIENMAILVSSWNRPPFLIDPHGDAVRWLKKVMKKQGTELVSVDMQRRMDPAVLVQIERALVTGLSLLLQNCTEHVESMLTPLIYLQNHMDVEEPEEPYIIQYCGRRLQSPPSFHLYLSSLVTRPQLDAEIASTTALISYTTSSETLQEDLLSRTFARVRRDLYQEQKLALLAIREYRVALKSLAKRLAQRLLEGESDDIWDSTEFVTKVVQQKQQVYHRLQQAEQVLEDIHALREELAPVAERGALLFSLLRSLEMVQREYKFSKTFFLNLFDKAVGEDFEEEEEEEEKTQGSASKDTSPRQDKDSRHGRSPRSFRGEEGVSIAGSNKQQENEEGETETSAESSRPKSEELVLPDAPDVPTQGVSFDSMSVNQTKMLVDGLTQLVYDSVSQSLYPEHRLLFATMLCLHMQLEGEEFAEEELSLLLQGNPGLGGGLPLSLEDFDCEAPMPEWIPQDKFEDLMAMSVLPGPLDSLCKHVAEDADDWERWYQSLAPEEERLPYRPPTEEQAADAGTGSPDLGPMTDFHQLLIMRCLRPDRLPFAMAKYVQKHMPGVLGNKATPSLEAILDAAGDSHIGVLVLLSPSLNSSSQPNIAAIDIKKHPVEVLKSLAKDLPVEHVAVGEGCESRVDVAIDTAHNNEGWVIIEDIHLASPQFLHELKLHLARVSHTATGMKDRSAQEGGRSSFQVWLTSEPSATLPEDLLNVLHKVAWDVIGPHLLGGQEAQGPAALAHGSPQGMLKKAIGAALSSVPPQSWDKLRDKSNNIRNMVFGLCVVQGVLLARQLYGTRGLSLQYPLSGVQLQQGIDILVGKALNEGGEEPTVDEACKALAEMVYGNIMGTDWDCQYTSTILHEILYLITNQSGRLMLGNVPIPTPAANVDPSEYPHWFESCFKSDHSATEALLLDESVDRDWNEASSSVYVAHLDQLLTHTQCGPYPSKSIVSKEVSLDVQRLRFAIDLCVDSLPPLLELGRLPSQVDSSSFSFQYHRPSMVSVATVPPEEMPESLGFILLQECHWLNLLLCHVRQSLHNLDQCMLGGTNAIPASLTQLAEALQSEEVPVSWTHPRCRPSSHTILSWLEDLQERYKQLHDWVKRGIVSREPDRPTSQPQLSHGQLTSVWLGGLVNPAALFTALRQEKAVQLEVPVSKITLSCEVVRDDAAVEEEEGGLYIQGLYIQGAAWDWQAGCLTEAEMGLTPLPVVYVKPVLTSEMSGPGGDGGEDITLYNCPVFMNKARQVCSLTLPLRCPSPTENFIMSGAAVILDAGCLLDDHKKGRTFASLKKDPIPMSARDMVPSIPAYSAPTSAIPKRRVSHDPHVVPMARKTTGADQQAVESGIQMGRQSQQSQHSQRSYVSATSKLSESAKQPISKDDVDGGSGHRSPTIAAASESTEQNQLAQDSGVVRDDQAGEVPPSTAEEYYSSSDEKPGPGQQGFDQGYSADDSQSESRKESDATEAGPGRARGLTSDDDTLGYTTDPGLDSRDGPPQSQPSY